MNDTVKNKTHEPDGGRKLCVVSVRNDVFEWLIDVRYALKSRMPKKLFLLKCQQVYSVWLGQQSTEVQAEHQKHPVKFSVKWLRTWCQDFHVSLSTQTSATKSSRILQSSTGIKCLYNGMNRATKRLYPSKMLTAT